ncbi:glycine zipper 2TM domain-containing protein [Aliiglaciecola sp. LCG003]|uniref:glycine zipper 2TM domain-containing protein n=1 Tax=Aliiglaciecola sp. LCG003 TaxID=3053655 RepID=UPI002573E6E0|nr:glycine zipper 2TM domain-containing protein [Aliiglaciecola sp. LCG003]WJG11322.1 glycine zipper 2TM domain-containing protein [Aliiglaciecola sp. LCG003]
MRCSVKSILISLTTVTLLSACASSQGPNESSGMIIGGILGGVLGHQIGGGHGQTAATVFGAMIGTAIGGNVGRTMDEADRLKLSHSLETVRTGVSTSWRNPDSGNYYKVVPTKTYGGDAKPCREYQIEATIGGKKEDIYGTACRQEDGSWKAKN